MDEQIVPPDLEAAGGAQATPGAAGLVEMLRSRGSMPAGLMESLRPSPMSPATMAYAAAVGGLNPGIPNHVTQGYAQQDRQRMQQFEMIDRVQQRHQRALGEKLGAAHTVLKDMLFGPNAVQDEATRAVLSKQYSATLSQTTGMQLPEGVASSWTKGGPSQANQKEIATMLAGVGSTQDPAMQQLLTQRAHDTYTKHGGTEQEWNAVRQTLTNPAYLESVNLPTPAKLAEQQAKLETAQVASWTAKNPQFKDTKTAEGIAGHANEFALRIAKRPLYTLDANNPDDKLLLEAARDYAGAMAARHRQTEDELALERKHTESDLMLGRQKELAKFTAGLKTDAPTVFSDRKANEALADIKLAQVAMTESRAMRGALDRMGKKGFLPSSAGFVAGKVADAKQLWNYNDPDVRMFSNVVIPYFIGLVDRGLNDEKGTRAMAMFTKQLELVTKTPTQEVMTDLFDLTEYMFARRAAEKLRLHERAEGRGMDPIVLAEERERFAELFPKGVPPDPSQTKAQLGPLSGGARVIVGPNNKSYNLAPGAALPEGYRFR